MWYKVFFVSYLGYAINNHMYYISNKSILLKMIRSSQSMTTFKMSNVLEGEFENIYTVYMLK